MSPQVTVIDYGSGNLHSVIKALKECGANVLVTSNPSEVRAADRLVLPGVGAFAEGMEGLRKRGLVEAVNEFALRERPLLGICLGMQMLMSESDEFGLNRGLDLISGRVVEIPRYPGFKVPHIGWSRLQPRQGGSWSDTIFSDTPYGERVYFVHSFSAVPACETERLADTEYSRFRISAAVQRGAIVGCQFHPEKSGVIGLAMLRRFLQS